MEVSTQHPAQPHLFDHRPSAFPLFSHHSRDSYTLREMPAPYHSTSAHVQPYHHPSNHAPSKISLPSISDLLNFSRESEAGRNPPSSQPRTEPAWQQPRSTYGAQLKVETTNIDPRLQRPLSPPMPGSAHPGSAPALQRSPMVHSSPNIARSADAEHASHQSDYPSPFDHHKRLSTVSQLSHMSQTSTQSADSAQSSPDATHSTTSSYSQRGSVVDQRHPPSEYSPVAHASSPQRRLHSPGRDHVQPYPQTTGQRSNQPYPQQAARRPPLPHQSSVGSIVTAASAGTSRLEDRYVCPSCNKAFSRPSSLRIHSHSHTGEKPFRCPRKGCGKAFSVRSNMKRHERGCHIDAAGYHSTDEEHAPSPEHLP